MTRALLLACDNTFLDEVLDYLGPDLDIEVALHPSDAQWRAAPLVLLDARAKAAVDRLPAHPWTIVIIGAGSNPARVAALYEQWRDSPYDAAVYMWPYAADTVRRLVLRASTGARRSPVRIGVIGGHGGAGASTLAVALAQAACHAGRRTALVDGDPLGGGIAARVGDGLAHVTPLRIIEQQNVRARRGGLAAAIGWARADVIITDLSRTLDEDQLAAAAGCDVVLVVTDAARNVAATRRILTTLTGARVPVAVVGRTETDHMADDLASDRTAPRAGDMPPGGSALSVTGAVGPAPGGALFTFATELLAELLTLIAEAAR